MYVDWDLLSRCSCPDPDQEAGSAVCGAWRGGGDITRELLFGKLRSSDQAAPDTGQTPTQLQRHALNSFNLFAKTLKLKTTRNSEQMMQWFFTKWK